LINDATGVRTRRTPLGCALLCPRTAKDWLCRVFLGPAGLAQTVNARPGWLSGTGARADPEADKAHAALGAAASAEAAEQPLQSL